MFCARKEYLNKNVFLIQISTTFLNLGNAERNNIWISSLRYRESYISFSSFHLLLLLSSFIFYPVSSFRKHIMLSTPEQEEYLSRKNLHVYLAVMIVVSTCSHNRKRKRSGKSGKETEK